MLKDGQDATEYDKSINGPLTLRENFHTIWISLNGKLPDQLIENLLLWKSQLPPEWRVFLWTAPELVDSNYLYYLQNRGILIRDVRDITDHTAGKIAEIFQVFREAWTDQSKDRVYATKLFSNVLRMLLMTGTAASDTELSEFAGVYVDGTDTHFHDGALQNINQIKFPYGFAFNCQNLPFSRFKVIDSNVSAFVPFEVLPPIGRLAVDFYYSYLVTIPSHCLSKLDRNDRVTFASNFTNVIELLSCVGDIVSLIDDTHIPLKDINANEKLGIVGEQNMAIKLTYNLNCAFNISRSTRVISFPSPTDSYERTVQISARGALKRKTDQTLREQAALYEASLKANGNNSQPQISFPQFLDSYLERSSKSSESVASPSLAEEELPNEPVKKQINLLQTASSSSQSGICGFNLGFLAGKRLIEKPSVQPKGQHPLIRTKEKTCGSNSV